METLTPVEVQEYSCLCNEREVNLGFIKTFLKEKNEERREGRGREGKEGEKKETFMSLIDCEKSKYEEQRRPAAGSAFELHIVGLLLCSLADAQGLQAFPGSADSLCLETGSHLGSSPPIFCSSLEPCLCIKGTPWTISVC